VSLISKSQATIILPGVSYAELDPYVEYVPHSVPRASRSTSKRAWADDASASVSSTKKPRQSGTLPSTQVVGSMLLGEHISMFCPIYCLFAYLIEYFLPYQMVLWLRCLRVRRMRMMMRPSTHVGKLSLYFCFLAIILEHFFWLVLVLILCSKRLSSLSSSGVHVSITPSLARGGDDIFVAAMPLPKPSVRLEGFSMKRKTTK
jgi:hypothetical protein